MNIIKKQINVEPLMIPDEWTFDFENINIDIDKKILQERIDWDITVKTLVVSKGWHKVTLSKSDRLEIEAWCKKHICGEYKSRDFTWVFKDEKDYVLFALRWS